MKKPQPTGYGWLIIDVNGTLVEAATDAEALELIDEDEED